MPGSFFEEERQRLIDEISKSYADTKGFEELVNHSNVLNRKLEEVHGIGKEFSTVAGLWGRFDELMGKVEPNTESIPGTGRPVGQ